MSQGFTGVPESHDAAESLSRSLIESLTDYAMFAVSTHGEIISWNAGAKQTFGYTAAEIIGRNFSVLFSAEDAVADTPAAELAAAWSGAQNGRDRWHVRKDGSRFWGTNTVQPLHDSAGNVHGITKLVRDITEHHLALEALSDSEERLRLLVESVHEYAIFATDLEGIVTSWNVGAQNTFGYVAAEVIGQSIARLYDDKRDPATVAFETHLRHAATHGHCDDERWLTGKNGTPFFCSSRLTQLERVPGGELRGFVMIAHDITQRTIASAEMRRQAFNDALTQLPNRSSFDEHLRRAIALMKRRPTTVYAVLFIDLDDFKSINDTFGHGFGDRVLERTARRLERCVRSGDVVARLGGDEFAILLNGISGMSDAADAVARIGIEMAEPFGVDGNSVRVWASTGIALGKRTYDRPEDILRDADLAMYQTKVAGRTRFGKNPTRSERTPAGSDIEADLAAAVERNELRLVFQPIFHIGDGSISGFEALVRWQHPRHGLLAPAAFISYAERSNTIVAIDRWVWYHAARQLNAWQARRGAAASLGLHVNISGQHAARSDLLAALKDMLQRTRLAPHRLHLEITETAIGERPDSTALLLTAIRALGIGLQIDNFGIGFSSLGRLGQLPVDGLKIDRSFVAKLDSESGCELVRTITTLAHNLGLTAIAQGVESHEQLRRLQSLGCSLAQGFLFSEPLDAAAAGRLLDASDCIAI